MTGLEHPLAPYAWEARYTDGRRLRRESPGGPWTEAKVPLEGLRQLLLLGPGFGAIPVHVLGFHPVAVRLRLRGQSDVVVGQGVRHQQRVFVGMQLPDGSVRGARVDERGHVSIYDGPEAGW